MARIARVVLAGYPHHVMRRGVRSMPIFFSNSLNEPEIVMNQEELPKRKLDPAKMQALRSLPLKIKQSLTREAADAFLYEDVWPDSLLEKLKGYFVDVDEGS